VLAVVIARGLGAEALGAYVFAATVGALVYALGSLSVTPIVMRDVARRPEELRRIASSGLQLRGYVVLPANVLLIGVLALVLPMTNETRAVTALLGVAVGLGFVTDVVFGLFQAIARFDLPMVVTTAYKAMTIATALVLVRHGDGIVALSAAVVILQAAQAALSLWLLNRLVAPVDWRPQPAGWSALAREAAPLALSGLADTVSNRADLLILGLLRSVNDVGIYGAAYNLYIGATLVVAAMQVALLPAFARASEAALRRLWVRAVGVVVILGGGAGSLFVFAADPLIRIIYGDGLAAAAIPLRILGPAAAVFVVERLMITTLIGRGQQRAAMYAIVPGTFINILSNYILIPEYGYNGAAAATLASEMSVLVIASILVWRKLPALQMTAASA